MPSKDLSTTLQKQQQNQNTYPAKSKHIPFNKIFLQTFNYFSFLGGDLYSSVSKFYFENDVQSFSIDFRSRNQCVMRLYGQSNPNRHIHLSQYSSKDFRRTRAFYDTEWILYYRISLVFWLMFFSQELLSCFRNRQWSLHSLVHSTCFLIATEAGFGQHPILSSWILWLFFLQSNLWSF